MLVRYASQVCQGASKTFHLVPVVSCDAEPLYNSPMTTFTTYYSLRIELRHSEPMIWRRLLVPSTITLPKLHRAIQGAMGWANSHLHQFHIGDGCYSEPDPYGDGRLIDEKGIKLSTLLVGQVREFIYEYDFGDDWQHRIVLEQSLEAHPSWKGSLCTAGQRACPPEDVGGIWGV